MTARIILFLITIIFYSNSVIGQNNLSEIEKLSATGKIWGFLKYYHPNVADGKFDWDKELFRILPKVRASINKEEMSAVFIEWINNLGPIKQCKSCKKDEIDYFNKNFNLNWIQSPKLFSIQLSDKLKYIEENRHQGKKHYIAYFKGEPKIAFFKNEQDYPDFDWSNKNLRLLTLFRYWNMVEYFFPAKYQTDKNWNEVLNKLIPKFQNPKSKDEYHKVMVELIVSLDDSHALIYPNQEFCNFGCYNVPVEFKIIHDSIVITKFYDHELAKLNDLKIGDIITKINGQNIHQKFEVSRKYIHGSNISRKKINSGYYLLNGSTQSINVEVIRNGKTLSKNIKRYLFKNFKYDGNEQTEKYKLINDSIGYIILEKLTQKKFLKSWML